jgi:hypothetical protein
MSTGHAFAVEANYIFYPGNMPDKATVFIAVFNTGRITLILHRLHGATPIVSSGNQKRFYMRVVNGRFS